MEPSVPSSSGRRLRTFQALANPSFRRLWMAAWMWYASRMMELVVVSWLVLELTDSPSQVALVGVSRMTPMFLLGLVAGSLADRFPKKRVMLGVQGLNLAVTVVMMLLLLSDAVRPWHAFLAVFLTGTAWTVDFSARRAYFSEIFGAEGLVNAVSLDAAALTGSAMVGPLLGGVLISLVHFVGAYVVMLAFYVVGLALLLSLPSEARAIVRVSQGGVAAHVADAVRTIRTNRALWTALTVTVGLNFFGFPYLQMVPVIARDVLGVGEVQYGALGAAAGMGALAGTLFIASRGVQRKATVYSLGAILMLTGVFLFSLSTVYPLSWALLVVTGIGMSGFATMQPTIALQAVEPEMRGRAMGAIALGIGASPLGMTLMGFLAETFGPQAALAVMAGTGVLVLTALRWRLPELRDQAG